MLGQSPHQAQTDLFKNLLSNQLNPKAPALPISARHPLEKARRSLCSALWESRLTEPPHQKDGCPVDAQIPLQPQ
jgi:hypothetical protein